MDHNLQSIENIIADKKINLAMWMLEEWLNYQFFHCQLLSPSEEGKLKLWRKEYFLEQNLADALVYNRTLPLWWGSSKWQNVSSQEYEQAIHYCELLGKTIPTLIEQEWSLLSSPEMFEDALPQWVKADIRVRGQTARQEWITWSKWNSFNTDKVSIPLSNEEAVALSWRPESMAYCELYDNHDYATLFVDYLPYLQLKQYPAHLNKEHHAYDQWVLWCVTRLLYYIHKEDDNHLRRDVYTCARLIADPHGAYLLQQSKEHVKAFLEEWCATRPDFQAKKLQADMGFFSGDLIDWWREIRCSSLALSENECFFNV